MLPVSTSNSLVFSRSKKKQLFAPLIEKALAKMHGSYMTLKSGMLFDIFILMILIKNLFIGRCDEGLQTLTGEPCEVNKIKTFFFVLSSEFYLLGTFFTFI